MRSILLAAIVLLALTAEYRASAQQFVAMGDEPAAAPAPVDTSSTTAQPAGNGPEQAGDLYQAKTSGRGTGDVTPSPGRNDPVPGALNVPSELLGTDRRADPKE